jgi:eukaryotic-like serine/threonine-protein kinase
MSDLSSRLSSAVGGSYRIERLIGDGGMASVFLAIDLRHQRSVAVKVMRPEIASVLGRERFLREIEVVAALTHPHILPLFDSGEADELLYYVMPYIEGESLRARLARAPRPGIDEVVRTLREIADALAAAHEQGIVHRDLKPDNVLLSGRHALLADFGLAKAVSEAARHSDLTNAGLVIGTPRYMSPEQASAAPDIDHRADIYALGLLGYEMLAGRPPFSGSTAQALLVAHLTEDPVPIDSVRDDVPPPLAAMITRCLAKDPAERWQSAGELLALLDSATTPAGGLTATVAAGAPRVHGLLANRARRAAAAVLGIAVVISAAWLARGAPDDGASILHAQIIPSIEQFVEAGMWDSAMVAARRGAEIAPGDTVLEELWETFTWSRSITSEPAGARVYRRPYASQDGEWELLGVTPLANARIPLGPNLLRFEHDHTRPAIRIANGGGGLFVHLDAPDQLPEEMVRVTGRELDIDGASLRLHDFFIDRHEVTNREYKRFVDDGGYQDPQFWVEPFVENGRTLDRDAAMARFTDQTGRPGPATWLVGSYPEGQDDYPVAGVSWYEAAAYARFAGKSLPTVHHWWSAHSIELTAWMTGRSVLEREESAPVGTGGVGPFGTFDMVGNVREWCYNEASGQRIILGGGWNDPDYMATQRAYHQPPFDRSPTNGIRLVQYLEEGAELDRAHEPVSPPRTPDLRTTPLTDDVFAIYARMFTYDRGPLDARVESADTTRHWIRQRISFNAAYGGERTLLYLFLPLKFAGPLQTVVYFPGAGVLQMTSIDQWRTIHLDYLIRSGRAVALPVLLGTFERGDGTRTTVDASTYYRERTITRVRDVMRTIDYLETRSDLDTRGIGYVGYSWGGMMAPIILALEPRLTTAALYVAGFSAVRPMPEADGLTYANRVNVPVLMLNGRLDAIFPLETSARPMFELLGTPPEHKRHVVSDGGHFVPRPLLIREMLDWLDRYLGPTTPAR